MLRVRAAAWTVGLEGGDTRVRSSRTLELDEVQRVVGVLSPVVRAGEAAELLCTKSKEC